VILVDEDRLDDIASGRVTPATTARPMATDGASSRR
jgi:hypothetical protein